MRYQNINNRLFIENRKKFAEKMEPGTLAIFFANDLMPKSADQFHDFHQNTDLFYLSGVDQEETILVLFPDAPEERMKEVLFVRKTSDLIAVWEGEKLTQSQAAEVSGVKSVFWTEDFDGLFEIMMHHTQGVYVNLNEHDRFSSEVPYKDLRFSGELREKFPAHKLLRSFPIMKKLRAVKSDIEVELMQAACNITHKAFERVLKFVKPGVIEYEIEAEIISEFIRNGSSGHAYHPIIAAGKDACVLHYDKNDKKVQDGDLILMDFGCTYANYASDLTRTIPANGKFSPRQKEVYNAVLDVMKEATNMLRPGTLITSYQEEVGKMIEGKLIDLKILSRSDVENQNPANPLYRRYFPHGTSHHIGLDVHDIPDKYQVIEEGMAFTCEPGIYIPEENIGVRIENDVIVTSDAPFDLMREIPIEVEEIEDLMNS